MLSLRTKAYWASLRRENSWRVSSRRSETRVMAVFQRVSRRATGRYLCSSFSRGMITPSSKSLVQDPSRIELMRGTKWFRTSSGRCSRCLLVIPDGPPHFPGRHRRSASRNSLGEEMGAVIFRKAVVSRGVGLFFGVIVRASLGASGSCVSTVVSSSRRSEIRVSISSEGMALVRYCWTWAGMGNLKATSEVYECLEGVLGVSWGWGGKFLNGFFNDAGGGINACVDLFGCVDLGPFLFGLYLLGGGGVRSVHIGQYVLHDSSKCVGGVSKFLLAAAH